MTVRIRILLLLFCILNNSSSFPVFRREDKLHFLPCRRHRSGDLRHHGGLGDSRQIPLQEKGDVSKPGSEGRQTGRQPGLPLQQPGRLSERLRRKPKGVFHLSPSPLGGPFELVVANGGVSLFQDLKTQESHAETQLTVAPPPQHVEAEENNPQQVRRGLKLATGSWLVNILVNRRGRNKYNFQMFHYCLCKTSGSCHVAMLRCWIWWFSC